MIRTSAIIASSITLYLLSIQSTALAGWFSPKDYDECILDSMKGVTSNKAASMIERSCRKKFPTKIKYFTKEYIDLTYEELKLIDGNGGMTTYGNAFAGTIYNGSSVIISSLKIKLTTTIKGESKERIYTASTTGNIFSDGVSPNSSGTFQVDVFRGPSNSKYTWSIIGAIGYNH